MNRTTNLNLKKPESNEYINIQDLNENFEELDKLGAPEFDDTGEVEGITDRASLLSSFVSKMPMVKFLRNIKAGFKLALYAGEIVNDCVTDNSALPLSAAQGKALMDLYTVLNTKHQNLNADFQKRSGSITAFSVVDKRYIYLYTTGVKYGVGLFLSNQSGACIVRFLGEKNPTVVAIGSNNIAVSYDSSNSRFIADGVSENTHWLVLLGGNIGRSFESFETS